MLNPDVTYVKKIIIQEDINLIYHIEVLYKKIFILLFNIAKIIKI